LYSGERDATDPLITPRRVYLIAVSYRCETPRSFGRRLCTLVFVLRSLDAKQVRAAIGRRFPVRTVTTFSFAVAGLLFLKCLTEIMPTILSNRLPPAATGHYTLVDQALDLGPLTPFCVMTGILLTVESSS